MFFLLLALTVGQTVVFFIRAEYIARKCFVGLVSIALLSLLIFTFHPLLYTFLAFWNIVLIMYFKANQNPLFK